MTTYQYQGNLEETYLSDMFTTIFRHNVPGLMRITHDDTVKEIFISGGNVVHASSNDRTDRLGAHLYRTGKLTREQLLTSLQESKLNGGERDSAHGRYLIENEILSPAELYEAIRGQMESIVWSVFSWQSGEVTFQIGEMHDEGRVRIHLPMRQVIIRGILKVSDTKSLVARLGKKSTVFRPSYAIEDLLELGLSKEEYALLRLIDGERKFFDVCNDGPFGMSENARLIYAFRLLGLIEVGAERPGSSAGVKIRLGDKPV